LALSQSRFARPDHDKAFSKQDFLFAVVAHALIVCVILVVAWWDTKHTPEPPIKRIEVTMISAQALEKIQQSFKPKKIKRPQKVKRPKKTQPLKKIKPITKKKPVVKFEKKVKTIKKTRPKKTKVEPDFDPFAPIESSSNSPSKARHKPKTDIANLMSKQLSTQEIDQYIAMMQAAVQRHWKVPGGIQENTPDPLVEMILQRNGHLLSVKIIESSGNRLLDQTLISAIRAAEPFQIPSEQFESFRNNRIRFHPL